MSVIKISDITKDYGRGRGIFDVSFDVKKGEVMGFLGPNGAGKTTTIRHLMGFIHPDKGSVSINGMNCFTQAAEIQGSLGYLPGEIGFMDDMTGIEFIKFIASMKRMKSLDRAKELTGFFGLDTRGKIKKMSKGMKQKIGIVCAFMHDPEVLILDEPTSGLDPLMQSKFIELILQEKQRGKTILMSSHLFEEVEKTCDRIVIIRNGHIVDVDAMTRIQKNKRKIFNIKLASEKHAREYAAEHGGEYIGGSNVSVGVTGDIDAFIKALGGYPVLDVDVRTQSLEEFFMQFYGGADK